MNRTVLQCADRSWSDLTVCHEAKEGLADALPQAPKNRKRIRGIR